jgi:sulfide:quinone oxidoreductase
VGGGAAGLSTATSLIKRDRTVKVSVIEPSNKHYYQPGWTMVGRGVFEKEQTEKDIDLVWPTGVERIEDSVVEFNPEKSEVTLASGDVLGYEILVVCPGLKLDWDAVDGLSDSLGTNGVTSNYRYDMAPYTWELTQTVKKGNAIFTQPPMPIKCAGAPQKAMYLSCDYWLRNSNLGDINVSFSNAGPVLFGCATYVPPLMEYVEKYGINLEFGHNLKKVDGPNKVATFSTTDAEGNVSEIEKNFDMLHVCPPQTAPDFIKKSSIANPGGWVDVDDGSMQHKKFPNIFSLGDVSSTPNAKTAAAVRKQAPIVAANVLATINKGSLAPAYDGYGSCPLTVEHGKIILAEFGYGGKVMPTFPWDSTKARRSAWFLKKSVLPMVYWNMMLKGREWLTK